MRFDQTFLDEIRARLPVSQVVARRVKLKRQGREFIGLSPFKTEKTPSFTVNDQKGFYHCFASGEHGDVFTFVMKTEGLAFPEAVERLAEEAGVPMPKVSPELENQAKERGQLYELMQAAATYFEHELQQSKGKTARHYLEQRGVSREQQQHFRIGYAPNDRSALKSHLAGLGFAQSDMIEAGLLIAGDDIPVSYNRFRHRIIFPITNLKGQVIAFGGRALDPDQPAKYINSPETPLFHKGYVLFNAAKARQAAYDQGNVIVVEGYMDVIALAGGGILNAVAPLGTALTEHQLKLLWRMAPEPLLCFDGDGAGTKAAYRALETALPHLKPGHSVRFVFLPDGQDPDDVIRGEGPSAMRELLDTSQTLVDVLWKKEVSLGRWDTPEKAAFLEERVKSLVATIQHPTVRDHFSRHFRERIWTYFRQKPFETRSGGKLREKRAGTAKRGKKSWIDWRDLERLKKDPKRQKLAAQILANEPASDTLVTSSMLKGTQTQIGMREAVLLMALLNHPWLLDNYAEEVAELIFESKRAAKLRNSILQVYTMQNFLDRTVLDTQLSRIGLQDIIGQIERTNTHKSDKFALPEASRDEVEQGWCHILAVHRNMLGLKKELDAAERAFQTDMTEENYARLRDIRLELLDAEGLDARTSENDPDFVQAGRITS